MESLFATESLKKILTTLYPAFASCLLGEEKNLRLPDYTKPLNFWSIIAGLKESGQKTSRFVN
jgi:hypothetical protein